MGDILHALPAVTALRATLPNAWIGWAIEPQWEALLHAHSTIAARSPQMPVVDRIHSSPAKHWARHPFSFSTFRQILEVRRTLRSERYDICIDLQGAVRSAWIGRMANATRLIGEASPREPLARWFFDEPIATRGVHVIEQANEVVAAATQNLVREIHFHLPAALPVDPEAERWRDTWLREKGIDRFVILNPGAGWGAKRWPVERYRAVASELQRIGYATVVNAGPGELPLAETVCSGAKAAFAMPGDLGRLIACMRRASLFIGGDTGPLHLAAALRIPVVGIYGPTDPARNGPYKTAARVLRHADSKRDHTRRTEPEAGLLTITVDDVLDAAWETLERQLESAPPSQPL